MKDYYYTLGVSRNAALSEIQQAYKKLSLKFHPEKNDNDAFYALHYKKVREAYLTLSDEHKRFQYDKVYQQQLSKEANSTLQVPSPVITAFFASKTTVKKGDVITLSWEVLHADKVSINLIGEVASNGTQTIRLTSPHDHEPYLYLDLEANNSSNTTVSKQLVLKNATYQSDFFEVDNTIATTNPVPNVVEPERSPTKNKKDKLVKKATKKTQQRSINKGTPHQQQNVWIAYSLIAALFFMIIVMLYTLFLINPIF